MGNALFVLAILLVGLAAAIAPAPASEFPPVTSGFLENLGQVDPEVRYHGTTADAAIFFESDGIVLVLADHASAADAEPTLPARAREAEFQQGHIPGAFSLPLFSDEERAMVGTTYTQQGKDPAILKGRAIVGPKLEYFVKTALELAPQKEALVHCWRGGMRSEAMAWLFQFSGIKTRVLEGGYKAYRHYIREAFDQGPEIVVLGGMTGSGKTELLNYPASKGEQVVDLEALAHHKGSAFGALGREDQPTNEQFENDLAAKWLELDPSSSVWLDEVTDDFLQNPKIPNDREYRTPRIPYPETPEDGFDDPSLDATFRL